MLDFLFRSFSFVASFGFPIFASYKALQCHDIALLRAWLMYWVVIAVQVVAEFYLDPFVRFLPFYQFFRFLFALWLVLPQFQGATYIYLNHVEPFLVKYEPEMDRAINQAHSDIASYIGNYLRQIFDLVKSAIGANLLASSEQPQQDPSKDEPVAAPVAAGGFVSMLNRGASLLQQSRSSSGQTQETVRGAPGSSPSYVDSLLSRFRVPTTAPVLAVLGSVNLFGAGSESAEQVDLAFPSNILAKTEKLNYLSAKRLQLQQLLSLVDEQEQVVKDEDDIHEFDHIDDQDMTPETVSETKFKETEPVALGTSSDPATADSPIVPTSPDVEEEANISADSGTSKSWIPWR